MIDGFLQMKFILLSMAVFFGQKIDDTAPQEIADTDPTVTFSDLYNGESITLPRDFYKEVQSINDLLKQRLSPSDYLEILKGEKFIAEDEYYDGALKEPSHLRKKLMQIANDPENDWIFARPHFIEQKKKGALFHPRFRYWSECFLFDDEVWLYRYCISFTDEDYILSVSPGLSEEYSTVISFWNAKTTLLDAQFAAPSNIGHNVWGREIENGERMYSLFGIPSEAIGISWAGQWDHSYIVKPGSRDFQSFQFESEIADSKLRSLAEPVLDGKVEDPAGIWYRKREVDLPLLHPLKQIPELHVCWDAHEKRLESGYYLNLSTLTLEQVTVPRDKSAVVRAEEKIRAAMMPAPSYFPPNFDHIDMDDAQGDYVLFTRFEDYYDRGSALPYCLLGLLAPDGEVYLFPTILGEVNDIKPEGKLTKYASCVVREPQYPHSEEFETLVDEGYHYVFGAPYVRCMRVTPSADKKRAELVMGLNVRQNEEGMYLIDLDLSDFSYKIKHEWKGLSRRLPPLWLSKQRLFLRPESDYQYSLIRVKKNRKEYKIADLFIESPQRYAIVLKDGRYAGSPGCEDILDYGDGERVVSMRKLAPWKNRPAEVLKAIGGQPESVAALGETTRRWLVSQGFDPDHMPPEPSVRDFPIVEVELPKLYSQQPLVKFDVKLKATAHDITRLEVRADGVLIPQQDAGLLPVPAGEEKTITVEVPLACGQTWIELSAIDREQLSGESTRFRVLYRGDHESELYIVALGVSTYDDPNLELRYAAKDAADIVMAFEKYGFGAKHTLLLTDKEVKKDVMTKVKDFLASAREEDRVILYMAGHGVRDAQWNYYYAPVDFVTDRMVETGIAMQEIISGLQSTKARHRLLLLETNFSGLIEEKGMERLMQYSPTANRQESKRYVEDVFSLGSGVRGVNVLAGTSGTEIALEAADGQNDLFTAAMLRTLLGKTPAKDLDGDGFISVEEWAQHVVRAVSEQSSGAQNPCILSAEGAEDMIISVELKDKEPQDQDLPSFY